MRFLSSGEMQPLGHFEILLRRMDSYYKTMTYNILVASIGRESTTICRGATTERGGKKVDFL